MNFFKVAKAASWPLPEPKSLCSDNIGLKGYVASKSTELKWKLNEDFLLCRSPSNLASWMLQRVKASLIGTQFD